MFDKNSGLVRVWASLILQKEYTYDQCPRLSNLKDIVGTVLEESI